MKYPVLFLTIFAFAAALLAQDAPAPSQAGAAPAPPASTDAPAATPDPGATPAPAAAPAPTDPNKVVLSVGEESITAADFDRILQSLPEQVRMQAQGPAKRQMAEQIVRLKLLAAEARKLGLDKDKAIQTRIQFQADNLLAGAVYNKFAEEATVSEELLRKQYEEKKDQFETISARHILIKFKGSPVPGREGQKELTEEEALAKAQEIRKQLEAGADFAELAKKESDDTGSGASGGDLGTFGRGQMVPEFEQAASTLPVSQVSEPVKTQFGYHLIRVDKRETKPFEEVREQLENQARPAAARDKIEQLRKEATVTLDDAFFGPDPKEVAAAASAPAAPASK